MNVEVYQGQIDKKYNTKLNIPMVYYSQIMAVTYGASAGLWLASAFASPPSSLLAMTTSLRPSRRQKNSTLVISCTKPGNIPSFR